jgi:hypothetical protein
MSNKLRKQFIENYLRYGADSEQFKAVKEELYNQGASRAEIVELVIAANLYGNLENFRAKQA